LSNSFIARLFAAAISLFSAIAATTALAQSPIGDAASVENDVEATLNHKPLPISDGRSVFQNEHLQTGDASQATLVFLDSTDFSLGPTSKATLNRFIYNPDTGGGRVQIEADGGVYRFVTGKQDKKDYAVVTPSGTIRVKGTEFQLLVAKDYIIVALESGALTVTTNKGRVVPLDQPGTSLKVHKDGRVEGPKPYSGTITQYANAQFPYFASALPSPVNVLTAFNFTGCYVGAQIGGSGGNDTFDNTYGDSYLIPTGQGLFNSHSSNTQHGFAAGGLSGCSYQIGPVVVGGEAEYGYDGQSSNETIQGGKYAVFSCNLSGLNDCLSLSDYRRVIPNLPEHSLNQSYNVTGVGRVRTTVGYAILPNLLFYVAGGWTFASTNTSLSGMITTVAYDTAQVVIVNHQVVVFTPTSRSSISTSSNKLVNGANVGFGGEYAFTRNIIARLEYVYDRLTPSYNYNFVGNSVTGASQTSVKTNENTVRAALLFKF
jgi:FecR protein